MNHIFYNNGKYMNRLVLAVSLSLLLFISCREPEKPGYELIPVSKLSVFEVAGTSVTFEISYVNSVEGALLCTSSESNAPDAEQIFSRGIKVAPGKVVIPGLNKLTSYRAYLVSKAKDGKYSKVESVEFTSGMGPDDLYPWEDTRKVNAPTPAKGNSGRFTKYSHMDLLYGGGTKRSPLKWTDERFAPHVSYIDRSGKEHWLFDAFLALEISTYDENNNYRPFGTGYGGHSAGKKQWQDFIDYWFEPGAGFDALDKTVAATAERIGDPSSTRKVVVAIPDATIYDIWDDSSSSTVYWGELNGRKLDFSLASDRVAACKWFIDEVRRRWYEAGYANLEFYGFYCLSEHLSLTEGRDDYAYFRSDELYPLLCDYVHSCNEPMSWIPYNWAAGFDRWKEMHFDFVMNQPNYEWHPEYSMTEWKARAVSADLSIEFELDSRALENSDSDWEGYRTRFLYYFNLCRDLGLCNGDIAPFSYYMDGNALYMFSVSQSEKDKELYHTLCEFIISNH